MVSKYDLIFEQWKASIDSEERSVTYLAVQGNFEDLFSSLKGAGLSIEDAHEYLPRAIKVHSPDASWIKNAYKKKRRETKMFSLSEKEYGDQWIESIKSKANIAFYEIYPILVKKTEKLQVKVDIEQMEFEAEDDSLTL